MPPLFYSTLFLRIINPVVVALRVFLCVNHIKNALQKAVKQIFPAGLSAKSCTKLQSGAITIWLSNLLSKADEIKTS